MSNGNLFVSYPILKKIFPKRNKLLHTSLCHFPDALINEVMEYTSLWCLEFAGANYYFQNHRLSLMWKDDKWILRFLHHEHVYHEHVYSSFSKLWGDYDCYGAEPFVEIQRQADGGGKLFIEKYQPSKPCPFSI